MEELIIIALILGAGYYCLTHQTRTEEKEEKPLTHSQAIQTEPLKPDNQEEQKALESTLDELIKEIKKLNHTLK